MDIGGKMKEEQKEHRTSLFKLFITFAKMGAVTFGGGYAMLPILQREVVEKNKWCTDEEILDYFAVGQCTPGIIAVNTATFIGYKTRGIIGGIIATLGLVFPSIVIISIIYNILAIFQSNVYVQYALSGIQVSVAALITVSVIKLAKKSIVDYITAILAVASFLLMILFDLSPILFVVGSILIGIAVSAIKAKKGEAK